MHISPRTLQRQSSRSATFAEAFRKGHGQVLLDQVTKHDLLESKAAALKSELGLPVHLPTDVLASVLFSVCRSNQTRGVSLTSVDLVAFFRTMHRVREYKGATGTDLHTFISGLSHQRYDERFNRAADKLSRSLYATLLQVGALLSHAKDQLPARCAEFLTTYYFLKREDALDRFHMASFDNRVAKYQKISGYQTDGPMLVLGCGEYGFAAMDALPTRPLILLDNDPLLSRMLGHYASMHDRSITVLQTNIKDTVFQPIGLVCAEFVLHMLNIEEIGAVLTRLHDALMPGGKIYLYEPSGGCCNHDSEAKILLMATLLGERFPNLIYRPFQGVGKEGKEVSGAEMLTFAKP